MSEFDENFEKDEVGRLIEKAEKMIFNNETIYFDVGDFEIIIDYYLDGNDMNKALKVISIAKLQHPGSVEILIRNAKLLSLSRSPNALKNALKILDKATSVEANNPDIEIIKGKIHHQLKDYEKAIVHFEAALDNSYEADLVYGYIGQVLKDKKDYKGAIASFDKVLQLVPEDPDALFEISLCYELMEKQDDCITYFNKYLSKHPYDKLAWYYLGLAHFNKENYSRALIAFDYTLLIDDEFGLAYFNKGNALVYMEKYESAAKAFKNSLKYDDVDAVTLCNIAECYEKLKHYKKAIDYYKKSLKFDPEYADAWLGLGITLDLQNYLIEGIHYIRKAVKLDELNAEYWFVLADAEYKLGNHSNAEKCYKKVTIMDMENELIWLDFSDFYFETSRGSLALEVIEEGLTFLPENTDLLARKVCYLYKTGKVKEAIGSFENLLDANPKSWIAVFYYLPELEKIPQFIELVNNYTK